MLTPPGGECERDRSGTQVGLQLGSASIKARADAPLKAVLVVPAGDGRYPIGAMEWLNDQAGVLRSDV